MRESKAELTDRLRRKGRFDEFKKRREELRAKGIPAKHAWNEAAVEFGPMTPEIKAKKPTIDLQPLKGKPSIPIDKAAAWVFEYIDADWMTPADAPSPGAWSLLHWARSSHAGRSEFYKTFVHRLWLIRAAQIQEEQEKAADRERERRRMDQLFGQFDRYQKKD